MSSINNIFDLYQVVYNTSIKNGTISKRRVSSYDIVIIIFFSLIFLMIFTCIIKIFVRRCRQYKKRNDLKFKTDPIVKIKQEETNVIVIPSESASIK